jgi:hypothetical protein
MSHLELPKIRRDKYWASNHFACRSGLPGTKRFLISGSLNLLAQAYARPSRRVSRHEAVIALAYTFECSYHSHLASLGPWTGCIFFSRHGGTTTATNSSASVTIPVRSPGSLAGFCCQKAKGGDADEKDCAGSKCSRCDYGIDSRIGDGSADP